MKEIPRPTPRVARRRQVGVAAAMAASAAGLISGVAGYNAGHNAATNDHQPDCDIPVEQGDSIRGLQSKLDRAGDRGDDVQVLDGRRNLRTPDNTPRYLIDGGLRPGDTLRATHVDPEVCQVVGGLVVGSEVGGGY